MPPPAYVRTYRWLGSLPPLRFLTDDCVAGRAANAFARTILLPGYLPSPAYTYRPARYHRLRTCLMPPLARIDKCTTPPMSRGPTCVGRPPGARRQRHLRGAENAGEKETFFLQARYRAQQVFIRRRSATCKLAACSPMCCWTAHQRYTAESCSVQEGLCPLQSYLIFICHLSYCLAS